MTLTMGGLALLPFRWHMPHSSRCERKKRGLGTGDQISEPTVDPNRGRAGNVWKAAVRGKSAVLASLPVVVWPGWPASPQPRQQGVQHLSRNESNTLEKLLITRVLSNKIHSFKWWAPSQYITGCSLCKLKILCIVQRIVAVLQFTQSDKMTAGTGHSSGPTFYYQPWLDCALTCICIRPRFFFLLQKETVNCDE